MCAEMHHCRDTPVLVLSFTSQILTAQFTLTTLSSTSSLPPTVERTSVIPAKAKWPRLVLFADTRGLTVSSRKIKSSSQLAQLGITIKPRRSLWRSLWISVSRQVTSKCTFRHVDRVFVCVS